MNSEDTICTDHMGTCLSTHLHIINIGLHKRALFSCLLKKMGIKLGLEKSWKEGM